MPRDSAALAILRDLAALLERLGVRWYLFGAQAAAIYGSRRVTVDVDVTVDPGSHSIDELVSQLLGSGFRSRVPDPVSLARSSRVLPLTHEHSGMDLDLVFAASGLETSFLERAAPVDFAGLRVPVITAEDLIIAKVLSGRPRDIDDVRSVLAAQGTALDLARVRDVLGQLEAALSVSDLLPLLERALHAAGR